MTTFDTFDEALARLPGPIEDVTPIERTELPPGVPEVWLANLRDSVNFYGKQCCMSIQTLSAPGIIVMYEWDCRFGEGVGSSESNAPEPYYTDDGVTPAPFAEPIAGGPPFPCFGARVVEGETWTHGNSWPVRYRIHRGSPMSEHDWGGWWAFNSCEIGYSKYWNRNQYDQRGMIHGLNHWDGVIMSIGLYMGDVYKSCTAEPRPRQIRPFFERYYFPSHSRCNF